MQEESKKLNIKILFLYLKALAFIHLDLVRTKYFEIKRTFQMDLNFEGNNFWNDFEANYINSPDQIS